MTLAECMWGWPCLAGDDKGGAAAQEGAGLGGRERLQGNCSPYGWLSMGCPALLAGRTRAEEGSGLRGLARRRAACSCDRPAGGGLWWAPLPCEPVALAHAAALEGKQLRPW